MRHIRVVIVKVTSMSYRNTISQIQCRFKTRIRTVYRDKTPSTLIDAYLLFWPCRTLPLPLASNQNRGMDRFPQFPGPRFADLVACVGNKRPNGSTHHPQCGRMRDVPGLVLYCTYLPYSFNTVQYSYLPCMKFNTAALEGAAVVDRFRLARAAATVVIGLGSHPPRAHQSPAYRYIPLCLLPNVFFPSDEVSVLCLICLLSMRTSRGVFLLLFHLFIDDIHHRLDSLNTCPSAVHTYLT